MSESVVHEIRVARRTLAAEAQALKTSLPRCVSSTSARLLVVGWLSLAMMRIVSSPGLGQEGGDAS
eukprot:CAMPEP_0185212726 /NCGR_PEP_ID=MMETSP1140-20130426/67678_1 /TAXON_ID=298111 /ORGANISM="Pavlova sp., Strain CCMP459" /LENGTH=65 /DNA_ID=CAMNT_0027780585 /DNA_START=1457 /DNA_END=1654 /DNA_ORIENTATION=+